MLLHSMKTHRLDRFRFCRLLCIMQTCVPALEAKPIDNKPSHWVLPPGHWRLKLKICRLLHANIGKFDAEIKSYKDGKTIWIYHNHYLHACTYNSKHCRYVCNCYYYDRAVHISVAVDMRTLSDRNTFSSSSKGQVAAHWVTGLIIKRLCLKPPKQ